MSKLPAIIVTARDTVGAALDAVNRAGAWASTQVSAGRRMIMFLPSSH
jgi:hypothetical protein